MAEISQVAHPFPYFALKVTNDVARIEDAIKIKFGKTKDFFNRPECAQMKRDFFDNADLLGKRRDRTLLPCDYEVDAAKLAKIVERCLKLADRRFETIIDDRSQTISPKQFERLIGELEHEEHIGSELTRPFLERQARERGVKISEVLPPPPRPAPPLPVTDLKAESLPGQIRLSWKKPQDRCEQVQIRRKDWLPGIVEPCTGTHWIDSRVKAGKHYEYEVASTYAGSSLQAANPVSATARALLEDFWAEIKGTCVQLRWGAGDVVVGWTILRNSRAIQVTFDEKGVPRKPLAPGADHWELRPEVCEHRDEEVERGKTYHYQLLAQHPGGVCSYSPCRAVTLPGDPASPAAKEVKIDSYPGRIYLSWPPSGANDGYLVARAESPACSRTAPGYREFKESKISTLEDKQVEPGKCYWYSIHSTRGGIVSLRPTVVGPVLATAEVGKLQHRAGSHEVELTWQTPPGVKRVEVRRRQGRPPDALSLDASGADGQGIAVPIAATGRAIDLKLINDTIYGYRVTCIYAYPDGREVATRGEALQATPSEIPPRVGRLEARYDEGVVISWLNPKEQPMCVIRCHRDTQVAIGEAVPTASIDGLGQRLAQVEMQGAADPTPTGKAPLYLVFTLNTAWATFCGRVLYLDAGQPAVRSVGEVVIVSWEWPLFCKAMTVTHLTPSSLADGERGATRRVDRERSESGASLLLSTNESGLHRVELIPAAPSGKQVVFGPPARLEVTRGLATGVFWEFVRPARRPWSLGRGRATSIRLRVDGRLPEVTLKLMGRVNRMPESPTDGHTLLCWSPVDEGDEKRTFELPLTCPSSMNERDTVFCKLFALPNTLEVVPPARTEDQRL